MTVYIVISEHWDDTEILGVYASLEAAKQPNPSEWTDGGEGTAYITGLPYGYATRIEPYEAH